MADRNRSHSKINKLPVDLRETVEEKLINGETYESVSCYLKEQGHDIHFTNVGTYARNYLRAFEGVRMTKQFAKILAEDNIDRPTTELHEANNALISQIIMEALIDEDMSVEEKMKAAKSVAVLQSAQILNEKLKIDSRKAAGAVRTAMNKLKEEIYAEIESDPDLAQRIYAIADRIANETETP